MGDEDAASNIQPVLIYIENEHIHLTIMKISLLSLIYDKNLCIPRNCSKFKT